MGQSEHYWDNSNNGLKCWKLIELLGSVTNPTLSLVLDLKKKKKKRTVSQENQIVGERKSVFIEVFS